ncbi:LicD family protein [Aggregatimonas sangjinii]|uniref:LicD family protein n=1 Tax=Aggregatimonas sangjinii TaxID=2583587 RepID=A0A5B7SPN0_9FLAO|nr:LicD family protein [Aggregatimonas sangjinii]QCW99348.1 LicD family protein [Aggregatimonas sangjinii]
MAYDITLEGKNLQNAESLLAKATTIFEKHQVNYWLEGGTLLGIRRENRLLPWDNDLDISLHASETPKLALLLKELKSQGFRIRHRHFETTSDFFRKGDLRMIKIRSKKFFGLLKGKVCLDVFVKYTKEEKTYWEIDKKTKYVPAKFYTGFKHVRFKDKDYPIPENTDDYLTYRYGDWQTPVKDWDTSTDDNALA